MKTKGKDPNAFFQDPQHRQVVSSPCWHEGALPGTTTAGPPPPQEDAHHQRGWRGEIPGRSQKELWQQAWSQVWLSPSTWDLMVWHPNWPSALGSFWETTAPRWLSGAIYTTSPAEHLQCCLQRLHRVILPLAFKGPLLLLGVTGRHYPWIAEPPNAVLSHWAMVSLSAQIPWGTTTDAGTPGHRRGKERLSESQGRKRLTKSLRKTCAKTSLDMYPWLSSIATLLLLYRGCWSLVVA